MRLDEARPLLLDGGTGRELMRRGFDLPDALWSANALVAASDLVLAVHRDFVVAGADLITANTYGLSRRALEDAGLAGDDIRPLTERAVDLAREAAGARPGVAVAGSIGPEGGSYRADLVPPSAELRERYEERARLLAAAGVDVLLGETLTTLEEGRAMLEAGSSCGCETVVSFTLDQHGRLRGGVGFDEAAEHMSRLGAVVVLANCSTPEAIEQALLMPRRTTVPVGGYANAFVPIPAEYDYGRDGPNRERALSPATYRDVCRRWLEIGARVIGGCCGIGPSHIALLRELVDS